MSRLGELREQSLYRELRRFDSAQSTSIKADGRTLLNFSSNDYLGLANDPALREAAIHAVEKYGAGAGASRLISGTLSPHAELEEALADFKGTQAAITFSSGFAAAAGAICSLVDGNDVIVVDKLVHACIVDAARLSEAKLRVFGHNNLDDLEKILKWADRRHEAPALQTTNRKPRTLIVTESVFSMDGDQAPLRDLVEIKERHGALALWWMRRTAPRLLRAQSARSGRRTGSCQSHRSSNGDIGQSFRFGWRLYMWSAGVDSFAGQPGAAIYFFEPLPPRGRPRRRLPQCVSSKVMRAKSGGSNFGKTSTRFPNICGHRCAWQAIPSGFTKPSAIIPIMIRGRKQGGQSGGTIV